MKTITNSKISPEATSFSVLASLSVIGQFLQSPVSNPHWMQEKSA